MLNLISLTLLLSADSFFVGLLSGYLNFCPGSRTRLPILFGLCDGMAAAVGILFAGSPWLQSTRISKGLLVLSLLVLLSLLVQRWTDSPARRIDWSLYLIPIMLSFDNLAAGPALAKAGTNPVLCVALAGATSALLCEVGGGCGLAGRIWTPLQMGVQGTIKVANDDFAFPNPGVLGWPLGNASTCRDTESGLNLGCRSLTIRQKSW
jgi:putative Mn2+ efflux pump MntP